MFDFQFLLVADELNPSAAGSSVETTQDDRPRSDACHSGPLIGDVMQTDTALDPGDSTVFAGRAFRHSAMRPAERTKGQGR